MNEQVQRTDERRKSVGAPSKVKKDISLFEYLAACEPPLDKKIVDIVLAQTKVPRELSEDAAQEIRLMWSQMKPDLAYKPGQIASYAHRIATHSALRTRREVGAPVRLPGSAFRKRKDGSSYVTPGVLSMPLDWNELENWFNANDNAEVSEFTQQATSILMPDLGEVTETDAEHSSVDADEEETRRGRSAALEHNAEKLTRRQRTIMEKLIAGSTFEDIQNETSFKKGLVLREISIVAALLGPDVMGAMLHSAEAV